MSFCNTFKLQEDGEVSSALAVINALRWHLYGRLTKDDVEEATLNDIWGNDGMKIVQKVVAASPRLDGSDDHSSTYDANIIVWNSLIDVFRDMPERHYPLWRKFKMQFMSFPDQDLVLDEGERINLHYHIKKWLDFLLQRA